MNDKTEETAGGATWSGKLLDANGRQGTIQLDVGLENKPSSWRVLLANRDGEPTELKGETAVYSSGESLQVKSQPESGKGVEWEIDLKASDAGRYAKSAMVGQYVNRGASESSQLSQGVMILWQFQ